jgi:thiosulfate dehydrogenase
MNAPASKAGGPPSADGDTILSLVAYSYWLATGAPTGDDTMPGRGYPRLKETKQGFEPARGASVYAAKCALCHGTDGAGILLADGRILFPPLWGRDSYNWGAGMHKIDVAAAFINHNMPLGLANTLSDQDSWDVAGFMNSHERPQDPRFQGDLTATAERSMPTSSTTTASGNRNKATSWANALPPGERVDRGCTANSRYGAVG